MENRDGASEADRSFRLAFNGSNGGVQIYHEDVSNNSKFTPMEDITMDLGSSSQRWKDLYVNGTAAVGGDINQVSGVHSYSTYTDLNTYPYIIVPRVKRYSVASIPGSGSGGTQTVTINNDGFGQPYETANTSGVYMMAATRKDGDFASGGNIHYGTWILEVSTFSTGKIKLRATLNASNLTASVTGTVSFVLTNTNAAASVALMVTQMQIG